MYKVIVESEWSFVMEPRPSYEPSIIKTHNISKWSDITSQPTENILPEPNLMLLMLECDQATMDAINADPNYEIIYAEEIIEEII